MARSAQKNRLSRLETLEAREVPASVGVLKEAIIDFDGEALVTAAQFQQGSWTLPTQSVSSFRGMFTAGAPAFMDANRDGVINGTDADIVIGKIMAKVRQDYDPYHISVFVGDQDTFQGRLTDSQRGDVMILVNGGDGAFTGHTTAFGVAPRVDVGNGRDEMAFVFGGNIRNASSSLDDFVNRVARTVSHEMAHTFGLAHLSTATGTDAQTHHLMEVDNRDFTRDFGFQDIAYNTDSGVQNSHQILSQENVLGKSRDPWMAVLKPGELTVSGGIGNDSIKVEKLPFILPPILTQPPILLDGAADLPLTSQLLLPPDIVISLVPKWRVTTNGSVTDVPLSASGFNTLNNLDTAIARVTVLGQAGNDLLNVDASMTASATVDGGTGNDTLSGGSGADLLLGGSGADSILGNAGNDTLIGGSGKDTVRGGSGDDRVDGSDDNTRDIVQGGTGADLFVQHKIFFFFDEDTLLDLGAGDTKITV